MNLLDLEEEFLRIGVKICPLGAVTRRSFIVREEIQLLYLLLWLLLLLELLRLKRRRLILLLWRLGEEGIGLRLKRGLLWLSLKGRRSCCLLLGLLWGGE